MEEMTLVSQWNNKAEPVLEEETISHSCLVFVRSCARYAIRNKSYRGDSAKVPSPREMDTNPRDSDPGNLKANQHSARKREREKGEERDMGVFPTTLMISHPI